MAIVHLLRHGHVHNPEGILYGRLPQFQLSDAGEAMADAAAAHFKATGADVARVIASPLQRAQQTARPIADAFGLEVATDERLIEADNDFAGQRIGGPGYYLHPRNWWRLRNPWRPSWGEPYVEQRDRMLAAVRDAAASVGDREAVLVSHQLPIWVTRLAVEGRSFAHDPRKRECSLASATSLAVEGDEVRLHGYAEPAAHIEVLK